MTTRLLIADDHRMMREGMRSLLDGNDDMEVVAEAASGREAVDQMLSVKPDVVIMDIGMKDMNGIEATRWIRHECPQIPIVILSAHSDEHYVLEALEAGASAYVLKINAHAILLAAIRAVTKGDSFISSEITGIVVEAGLRGGRVAVHSVSSCLSGREREVLQLVAEGQTSGEIAAALHLATRTVEQHRRRIMDKIGLHTVADLTKFAIRNGIIFLEM